MMTLPLIKKINNKITHQLAKKIAIMPQFPTVSSRITIRELLSFARFPHHQGIPKKYDIDYIEHTIHKFNLLTLGDKFLDSLSGGQRQRAFVAMAYCQQTEYLLLDEPLNNLDMYYARHLMQLLKNLTNDENEKSRRCILLVHMTLTTQQPMRIGSLL